MITISLPLGGGAAGFVSSKLAAGLGKKVALIEKQRLGGECTLYGCIPSKTLIKAAGTVHAGRSIPDTRAVMEHVRSVVEKVSEGHPPEAFRKLGIEPLFGSPRFLDRHCIDLNGGILSARKFIIAAGSRSRIPEIEGIDSIPYLTNETLFSLKKLPASMIILGGGPVGIEMAQALNRLGVTITVVERNAGILKNDDSEMVIPLRARLEKEGVRILTKTRVTAVRAVGRDILTTVIHDDSHREDIRSDSLLAAVGRDANVEGLDLERAGVEYTSRGIKTDAALRTTAPNIYACGDVVGPYRFSHMAEYQAIIAARNASLPFIRKHADYTHVAWCTFTDPELAHAGMTEEEALLKYGDRVKVYRWRYSDTDRGKTDGAETGMSKFICGPGGRLLGAHILGARAGDIIHEAQVVKSLGIPFHKLYSAIHIYPTFSDVVKFPAKLAYIDSLRNNPFMKIAKMILGGDRRAVSAREQT